MDNKIIVGIVGVVVSIIALASVLMPIIEDVNDNERTVVNNFIANSNYSVFKTTDSNESHVITWTRGESVQYVDGEPVEVGAYGSYMIVSDKLLVSVSLDGIPFYFAQPNLDVQLNEDVTSFEITINGDSVTFVTNGNTPVNLQVSGVTWYALPDNDGTHKLHQQVGTGTLSINSIDQLYGAAVVTTDNLGFISFVGDKAVLNDGSIVDMQINATKDDKYVDLYTIPYVKGYYLDPEYLRNADDSPISPYFFLAPDEISVHTAEQNSLLSLVNVIPVLILLAILVSAIGIFRSRF